MFLDTAGFLYAYRWSADGSNFAASFQTGATVPLATWNHVAATFDSNEIKVYINGVEVGSKAYAWPLIDSPASMYIGTDLVTNRWFDGLID
jgi:hypothetical protein